MKVPVVLDVGEPTVNIQVMPPVMVCDIVKASELFGVSVSTLQKLARNNPDFPIKKIGRSLLFLVPDCYAWIRDYPDRVIPTD